MTSFLCGLRPFLSWFPHWILKCHCNICHYFCRLVLVLWAYLSEVFGVWFGEAATGAWVGLGRLFRPSVVYRGISQLFRVFFYSMSSLLGWKAGEIICLYETGSHYTLRLVSRNPPASVCTVAGTTATCPARNHLFFLLMWLFTQAEAKGISKVIVPKQHKTP